MARPQRHNVDYFPHYISDGKKMFVIESKFGNDGYATWFKILEILAKTDDHWLDLEDEGNLMFVAARCKIDEDRLLEIIEAITKLGEFDSDIWKQSKVIWSPKLIESLRDAYAKRSNECMSLESLRGHLLGLGRYKTTKKSKVKDTKLNETKEEIHPLVEWLSKNAPRVQQLKEPITFEEAERISQEFRSELIEQVFTSMHNYKKLLTNVVSANLTFRKWAAKDNTQSVEPRPLKLATLDANGNLKVG
jgi:hypothetical protein